MSTEKTRTDEQRNSIALYVLPKVIETCRTDMRQNSESTEKMLVRKAFDLAEAFIDEAEKRAR